MWLIEILLNTYAKHNIILIYFRKIWDVISKNIFILNLPNYNSAKFNFTLLADFEDSPYEQLTPSGRTFSPRFNKVNSHQTEKGSKMKYAWIIGYYSN